MQKTKEYKPGKIPIYNPDCIWTYCCSCNQDSVMQLHFSIDGIVKNGYRVAIKAQCHLCEAVYESPLILPIKAKEYEKFTLHYCGDCDNYVILAFQYIVENVRDKKGMDITFVVNCWGCRAKYFIPMFLDTSKNNEVVGDE